MYCLCIKMRLVFNVVKKKKKSIFDGLLWKYERVKPNVWILNEIRVRHCFSLERRPELEAATARLLYSSSPFRLPEHLVPATNIILTLSSLQGKNSASFETRLVLRCYVFIFLFWIRVVRICFKLSSIFFRFMR